MVKVSSKKGNKTLTTTVTYGSASMTPRLVVLREEAKKAGIDLKLKLLLILLLHLKPS